MTGAVASADLRPTGWWLVSERIASVALAAAIAALVAAGCQRTPPAVSPTVSSEKARLDRFIAEAAQRPPRGLALPDLSLSRVRWKADSAKARLRDLEVISTKGLSHQEQLSLDLLKWDAIRATWEPDLWLYTFDILLATSPLRQVATVLVTAPLDSDADRVAYLTMLGAAGRVFDDLRQKLTAQAAHKVVAPREQVAQSIPYLRSFAAAAESNPLRMNPARLVPVPTAARAQFAAQVVATIDSVVVPRVQALVSYVETELLPIAPSEAGIGQYRGGREAYRILVRRETTLEVTPEEVHQIGLRAVAEINARMQRVRDSLGFEGTKAAFHEQLRRDGRFFVKTPPDVGRRLLAQIERIEPQLPVFFSSRPKAPYGVRRLDPALESSMTYGYYSWGTTTDPTGYYNFNGSDLDQRSLLTAASLAFHELIPGHHFQLNLARENEAIPFFRRTLGYTGYVEGWAEYSSSVVAVEMGMYGDAYDLYGRLVNHAFFATRLVVDTGMNYYGWPRARAVAYMRENTLESDVQIDSETLRYSVRSPAQALAYWMGRETIIRLRAKAQRELGVRFDIRRFHDAVLMSGSLPLAVLERHIDWFIADAKAGRK